MRDIGVVYMKTELCPMGGRDNILRFEKSVVGKITNANQRNGMTQPLDVGGDVCIQVRIYGGDNVQDLDAEGGDVHTQIHLDEEVAVLVPKLCKMYNGNILLHNLAKNTLIH